VVLAGKEKEQCGIRGEEFKGVEFGWSHTRRALTGHEKCLLRHQIEGISKGRAWGMGKDFLIVLARVGRCKRA